MPKRVRPEVERRCAQLAVEHKHWSALTIAKQVWAEFPVSEDGSTAVSERWISERLPKWRDRSEYWTLGPGERDASFVLAVVAALHQDGREPRLSLREVDWLRAVHAAAAYLTPLDALMVARLYLASEGLDDGHELSHKLDLALAERRNPVELRQRWLGIEAATGAIATGSVTYERVERED